MTDSVRWRVRITVGVGIAVGVVMVLLGMEPRLVLVGCVVAIVAAAAWLVVDLGVSMSSVVWRDQGSVAVMRARPDGRVMVLRSRLRRRTGRSRSPRVFGSDHASPADEIIDSLVAVIDDRLLAEFGVDRSTDPAGAAELLGPDLTRFVTDPASRLSMTQPRSLTHTLALIEDL